MRRKPPRPTQAYTNAIRRPDEDHIWRQIAGLLEEHGKVGIGDAVVSGIRAAQAAGDHEAGRGWFAIADALQEFDGRAIH